MTFTEDNSEQVLFAPESPEEAPRFTRVSSMPRRFYRRSRLIPRDLGPDKIAEVMAEEIRLFYGDEPAPLPDGVVPAAKESRVSELREQLAEAVQLRRVNPSASITTEKRVNLILDVMAAYLDWRAAGHNILREEDHGYWFTELANELRDMIEWTEFLAEEATQELTRQAQTMDWMKL